eukprot:CAMPEP_0182523478 /NCGR_PEP_ID=MMETSP1323-20130603/1077_1 /TAXON_ID=236787 /ORGANISM="Florenciella parvula, Strain RCC1693" /LENGTH=50 /DNA_ID=CAMNT_0024731847 /DNA_START=104 /DNA_END=252 /DNA_ORIENTATION=-
MTYVQQAQARGEVLCRVHFGASTCLHQQQLCGESRRVVDAGTRVQLSQRA